MKFIKRTDLIVVALAVTACLIAFWVFKTSSAKGARKAEIYYYGKLAATVDLNEAKDRTFCIPQDNDVVFHVYQNGEIEFESSDCPDKICVKTGKLSLVGQSAACLPNGIVLKIVRIDGGNENEPDIVLGK